MAGTKPWAIAIIIACTIFTSIGSILLKKGVDRFSYSMQGFLDAYPVIIGLAFYFVGFILLTVAFKHGELSVLFPFVSLSFVWVGMSSYFILHEKITLSEVLGVTAIITGVVLIGLSSRRGRRRR